MIIVLKIYWDRHSDWAEEEDRFDYSYSFIQVLLVCV